MSAALLVLSDHVSPVFLQQMNPRPLTPHPGSPREGILRTVLQNVPSSRLLADNAGVCQSAGVPVLVLRFALE